MIDQFHCELITFLDGNYIFQNFNAFFNLKANRAIHVPAHLQTIYLRLSFRLRAKQKFPVSHQHFFQEVNATGGFFLVRLLIAAAVDNHKHLHKYAKRTSAQYLPKICNCRIHCGKQVSTGSVIIRKSSGK